VANELVLYEENSPQPSAENLVVKYRERGKI